MTRPSAPDAPTVGPPDPEPCPGDDGTCPMTAQACRRHGTPRPWPEDTSPTPEQLAGWLAVCTPAERRYAAERFLAAAQAAASAVDDWVRREERHPRWVTTAHLPRGRYRVIETPTGWDVQTDERDRGAFT